MIPVTVFIRKDAASSESCYTGISLSGHAGYGESGQDIVCAAVSALVFTTANSIEAFTEDAFNGEADEKTGTFSFSFPSDISPESSLLMNSLVLGLKNIEEEYGRSYIHIRFEEV